MYLCISTNNKKNIKKKVFKIQNIWVKKKKKKKKVTDAH